MTQRRRFTILFFSTLVIAFCAAVTAGIYGVVIAGVSSISTFIISSR
jgi:hypothetical protein